MGKKLLESVIEQYCRISGLSLLTLKKHLFHVTVFSKWLGKREFNRGRLREYIIHLQDLNWKPNSINGMVSTLKILCRELHYVGLVPDDLSYAIRSVKVGAFNPTLLTLAEIDSIIHCQRSWGKYHKWIDRRKFDFFFEIIARCALRRSEALNLRINYFDFESGVFKVIGKGNKLRTIPIPNVMKSRLYLWFMERGAEAEDWVFEGKRGGRAGISTFRDELKKRVQLLGIKKRVHFHLFRHTWDTEAIKAGLSDSKIMRIMGHTSFQSHLRYTHLVAEDCKDTMENHPLNNPSQRKKTEKEATKEFSLTSFEPKPS